MSFYQGRRFLPRRFRLVLSSVLQASGLPFSDVLTEKEIGEAFDEEESWFAQEEGDVFTPPLTLWAFLSQVLHKEEQRSCLAAVSRVIVLLVALGRQPCANNSGGYCKARAKLSETVLQRLATHLASGCEKKVSQDWLWKGRHVKLADGTTVSMPDTEANQAEYPQSKTQQQGLALSRCPIGGAVVAGDRHGLRDGDRTLLGQGNGRVGIDASVAGSTRFARHLADRPLLLLLFHDRLAVAAEDRFRGAAASCA